MLNQELTLQYGCDYLVGAFVKTKNLHNEVGLEVYETNNPKHPHTLIGFLKGDNDWILLLGIIRPEYRDDDFESEVVIRPGRTRDFREGEFWVDDVFVIPMYELPQDFFRPAEKLFIYAHILDPHYPYLPPDRYLNLFQQSEKATPLDRYDGEIRALDDKLGLLFETLAAAGVLDDTLLVLTSDHGEGFGEHGYWEHGAKYFYEETGRIPLIYYNPRLFSSSKRRADPVESCVDLLPSLVDLLKLKLPEAVAFQGQSYFQEGRTSPGRACWYETPDKYVLWDDNAYVKTVTDGQWKYVTNEYRNQAGDTEIRGVYRGDEGTEVTVTTPRGEETAVYPTIEDLRNSTFFKSCDEELRSDITSVYLAADKMEAMLFNLQDDPGEKKNVVALNPEKAGELQRIIREQIAADRAFRDRAKVVPGGRMKLTNDIKKELRALGYVN